MDRPNIIEHLTGRRGNNDSAPDKLKEKKW
jgi:hypothetical protein